MLKRIVSGIMLTVFVLSVSTLAFNIQQVEAVTGPTVAVVNPLTGDNAFTFLAKNMPINSTFIANVTVANVTFLAAWQLNITWDSTLLEIRNTTLNGDLYIPSDNIFGADADVVANDIGPGMAFWGAGIKTGGPDYVNVTYGTMCQIRFTVLKNDTGSSCNIHIVVEGEDPIYTTLIHYDAYEIPYTPQDATYELVEPQHEIGIKLVDTFNKNVVGQGFNLSINVTISNDGPNTESFDLTVYANTTLIGTKTVNNLAPATNITVTIVWNTSGFTRAYVIKANVTILVGETETGDNTRIDGTIKVSCKGDVNGNYVTNMLDYQRVKRALTSTPGSPNWNANADFNDDLTVDDADFDIVKGNIPSQL